MSAVAGPAAAPTTGPAATPGGRFAENIVHFARALRQAGLAVGPAAAVEAVRAVELAGIARRDDLYWTLHAVFLTRRDQHEAFDAVFRFFWRSRGFNLPAAGDPDGEAAGEKAPAAARRAAEAMLGRPSAPPRRRAEADMRETMSAEEAFRRRDFAQMSAEEIAEARRRMAAMVLPDDARPTRRPASAHAGRIDLRRTLRASLRSGGRLIVPRFRQKRRRPPPIVALCDISGSMSGYSRVLLHFLHALSEKRRVHSFLFGTRLTNVTRQLRQRDPDAALAACARAAGDWSGGTRIAAALAAFNRLWSRRVLGQGAIVLLLTDGLERDGAADLAREMGRLHRSCRRLIWLNPLLRYDRFAARAGGIRAMLPHVDAFRPIHSLAAVADLCAALAGDAAEADPRAWLAEAA